MADSVAEKTQVRIFVQGAVQGVGFRPFVYRLATELGLTGWVNNSVEGVEIAVEGAPHSLALFCQRLEAEKPPHAIIEQLDQVECEPEGYRAFEIRESTVTGKRSALILPDLAICPACQSDIFNPNNRRYHYPFTNCTHCGPRYSIIEALPYDRPNTSMKHFPMCDACREEYENPLDRRFHAQPNACPECGPQLALLKCSGELLAKRESALQQAAQVLRKGLILALKGMGGFHLMVDARNEAAVQTLRQRKHRPDKPFAVMFPSLKQARKACQISLAEARLLQSSEAPIVLLHRRVECGDKHHKRQELAPSVAPENPYIGVMLPYTPLHQLLLAELDFPVIATSGNRADEPICIDQNEALERLDDIADLFLVHDRPIVRPVDDSIVRIAGRRSMILRRARGYAPLPIHLKGYNLPPILAVGAHLKNTIAIASGKQVFISQHLGDLETELSYDAFRQTIHDLCAMYRLEPEIIACDLHPDYVSTHYAEGTHLPLMRVQHHEAHVLACIAEHSITGDVLGVSWDGTGYGLDGTIWGGEFLHITDKNCQRTAHLRSFRLPGGEQAVREPRRSAVGLLYELFGDDLFQMREFLPLHEFLEPERTLLQTMLQRNLNAPMTSSAGRLFDAIAALIGVRQTISFEGQAAIDLEFIADGVETAEYYNFNLNSPRQSSSVILDWEPLIKGLLSDRFRQVPVSIIAARFQNTLAEMIVAVAQHTHLEQVVLTGGCFQNNYLLERSIKRLRQEGFTPYWHQRVPSNDGGIALGQILAAARTMASQPDKC